MHQFQGLLGIVAFLAIGFAASTSRRRVAPRIVVVGVLLQLGIAILVLGSGPVVRAFDWLASMVTRVISYADQGSAFLFGPELINPTGPWGFVFAFRVLPIIIYFAALMSVLYHVGVMPRLVGATAWVMRRTMRVGGAESLCAAANIFVGQTEAPLCVRPYLAGMTRSQIMVVMTGGFATIAGSVLGGYTVVLGGDDPALRTLYAKHLMTASLMSAPAAFVLAKLMEPELGAANPETALTTPPRQTRSALDALVAGASDGLRLALNVGAMLVAFVAVIALLNWPLESLGDWGPIARWREANSLGAWSLQGLLGWIFTPAAFVMGIPAAECATVGSLLGKQVVFTEFVAYASLGDLIRDGAISPRSAQITTYALCGFANLPSIGIQIGGLSALAPEKRDEFVALGPRAMFAGAMACWMTASVAGLFIG